MTAMQPLRSILNDTPANAIDVDWNFQAIEDYVATDVIHKDGSVAMEAPLNLLGAPPSAPSHAVTKGYVDANVIPVSTIWIFAGDASKVPAGWWMCDGTPQSTTDPKFAALFAVIQYAYGGTGTSFNLPNLTARMPVGRAAGDALFGILGGVGGNRDATGVPAHTHTMKNHTHSLPSHTHNLANHQHYTPAHQHYTDAVTRGVDGGKGSAGEPAGWPTDSGTGIIFGQAGRIADINPVAPGPPVSGGGYGAGYSIPFSSSPVNWYNKDLSVNVGDHWSRAGDGAIWTNQINNNTSDGPNGSTPTGPNDNTTDGPSVSAIANANVPPYVVVNFIIRIG